MPCFVLAGCGGGGGGGSSGAFPTYADTAATLLPLVTAVGELKLVDPADPSNPTTVDTGLEPPQHGSETLDAQAFMSTPFLVQDGDYQAATHKSLGAHGRHAWYMKAGALYRVDLLSGNSHAPAQLSSIDDACDWNGLAIDYANPLNTHFVVRRAGADTDCFTPDDTAAYIALGAAIDEAGAAVSPDFHVFEQVQAVDGSLQRVLAIDLNTYELTSHAPDMSSTNVLMALEEFNTGPDWSRTDQYLRLRPVGGDSAIYHYDATDDSLTPVYTYCCSYGDPSFIVADSDYVYFNDGDFVLRMPHGSTNFQVLHQFGVDVLWQRVSLTANRMVFVVRNMPSGFDSLESLPKSGGAQRTVLEAASGTMPRIVLSATGGTRVYYRRNDHGPTVSEAGRVLEGGSGKVLLQNALWIGLQANPDAQIGALDPDTQVRTLLLREFDDAGVATVRGVDAASGIEGPVLGTIASASTANSAGIGRYVLMDVLMDRGVSKDFDVYFADVQTRDSLEAVADTVGADDAAP